MEMVEEGVLIGPRIPHTLGRMAQGEVHPSNGPVGRPPRRGVVARGSEKPRLRTRFTAGRQVSRPACQQL